MSARASTHLMSLDLGGGSVRCLVVDTATGSTTTAQRRCVAVPMPGSGGMGWDYDLDGVWRCFVEAAREALDRCGAAPGQIAGVATSSMRLSTVVLDGAGAPLLAVPNRDARAVGEGLRMAAEHGRELHGLTGHWPLPVYAGPRLLWLRAQRPEEFARARSVLSLGDWLVWKLCGEIATDPTQAANTLLFDVHERRWAWEWIDRLELPRTLFPEIREPGTRVGTLNTEPAAALGLVAGTPVSLGGADTQCGLLGVGALNDRDVAAIAGTTMPLQLVLDRPVVDEKARLWTEPHLLRDRWVLESNAGPTGDALDWFGRLMFPDSEVPAARALAEAACAEPGSAGMLSTLGAEVMNALEPALPTADLTFSHMSCADDATPHRHLARSVVEGMACAVRANLEQLRDVSQVEPATLRLAGGLSRSATFAEIVAGVLDAPVRVGRTAEATALGAALCAGVGAGVYTGLAEAAAALVHVDESSAPDPALAKVSAEVYAAWTRLREARAESMSTAQGIVTPWVMKSGVASTSTSKEPHRPRIFISADCDPDSLAALRTLGEVEYQSFREVHRLLTGPSLVEALEPYDVFVTEVDLLDAAALAKLPGLRAVVACRGDAVNVDVEACTAFGVPVLNAPGRNADAVADLTLAFLLMQARKFPAAGEFLRAPDIEAGDMGRMGQAFGTLRGQELWRRTVGLVGLGAVGRKVAQRLRPFGARVLVFDPYVSDEQATLVDARAVDLNTLLAESDFVSLHAAVTDETRAMIATDQLARMKPGAFLVNTARAALLDEDALAFALESGHLGGAALDAFSIEPPGSDHPLMALDNVIGTPHVGGNTEQIAIHQGEIVCEELGRLLRGERPRFALNPQTLDAFSWSGERPAPEPAQLAALANRPAPAVTDLQRSKKSKPKKSATAEAGSAAPAEMVDAMRRILESFVEGIVRDDELHAFSADKDVLLAFRLPDLDLGFYFHLNAGEVAGATGAPSGDAHVNLRMPAYVLDGMFTGALNAMEAATDGRLSFTGDTGKAMALQQMDKSLRRLYRAARDSVGDPGDLRSVGEATVAGGAEALQHVDANDLRQQICDMVNELYATQLITATGGNVSARIPDTDEIWITPSRLFKGDLAPDVMVRIKLDGTRADEGTRSPSSEWPMHCAIYRSRTEAQAVIHAHAPNATILANADLPFTPVSTEAAFFGNIPRVPFIMPGSDALAAAVSEAAKEEWAVLMKNHGLIVGGRSLRRAADSIEVIERSAEIILGCRAVGVEAPALPEEVIDELRKIGDMIA